MMSKRVARIVFICLALIVLRAAYSMIPYVQQTLSLKNGVDFRGYYIAATLVRAHQNLAIYAEATWDVDPVTENADRNTLLAKTSLNVYGTDDIQIYDYPPLLADLVVPFTYFGPIRALLVWNILNLAGAILAVCLLAHMLDIHSTSHFILLFAFVMLFRATFDCIYWAQVPIFLLVLLLAGFAFYRNERYWIAGFLFAFAIAIKLTPLIIIFPLLAWRDWKTLRAIVLWGMAIVGVVVVVNGWRTLDLFFLHEMPKMSGKFISVSNEGLGNAIQVLFHGRHMAPARPVFTWMSRVVSAAVLGFAYWLSRPRSEQTAILKFALEVFAIFLLLSACLSPVSWLHAYVLAIPILAIAGLRLWRGQASLLEMSLFSLLMLSLSVAVSTALRELTPLVGIAFCMVRLYELQRAKEDTNLQDGALIHPGFEGKHLANS
jgi:hypothetical protein